MEKRIQKSGWEGLISAQAYGTMSQAVSDKVTSERGGEGNEKISAEDIWVKNTLGTWNSRAQVGGKVAWLSRDNKETGLAEWVWGIMTTEVAEIFASVNFMGYLVWEFGFNPDEMD